MALSAVALSAVASIGLSAMGVGGVAWADEAYVFGLDARGVDSDVLDRAHAALISAIAVEMSVGDGTDTELSDVSLLIGCSTVSPECLALMAETLEVRYLVYGVLTPAEGGYSVRLSAFDGTGEEVAFAETVETRGEDFATGFIDVPWFLAGNVVVQTVINGDSDTVLVDGTPVRSDGSAQSLVGTVQVEARQGGRSFTRSANCSEPGYCQVTLEAAQGFNTPILVMSLGGAGLVAAGGFGILTLRAQDEFSNTQIQADADAIASEGRTYAALTNVFLVAGLATAGAGLWMHLRRGRDEDQRIAWSPLLLPGGAGVSVSFTR